MKQQTTGDAATKKKKNTKIDYDKIFEERNAGKGGVKKALEEANSKIMSKDARGELLSRAAEDDITESLFGEMNITANTL